MHFIHGCYSQTHPLFPKYLRTLKESKYFYMCKHQAFVCNKLGFVKNPHWTLLMIKLGKYSGHGIHGGKGEHRINSENIVLLSFKFSFKIPVQRNKARNSHKPRLEEYVQQGNIRSITYCQVGSFFIFYLKNSIKKYFEEKKQS